jgi:hypothetical protein
MQTAIGGVVGDGAVAAGPAVLQVEEKEVQNSAEVVVLDPGRAAIGGVEKGISGSPAVERVNERDRIHLARHGNNRPGSSGVGGVRQLAHVTEERGGSDPAFVRRKGGDSLQTKPGGNGRLLCPARAAGGNARLHRAGKATTEADREQEIYAALLCSFHGRFS